MGQDRRDCRGNLAVLVRVLRVSAQMQVGLDVEVIIKYTRQAALFKIRYPKYRIQTHLMCSKMARKR